MRGVENRQKAKKVKSLQNSNTSALLASVGQFCGRFIQGLHPWDWGLGTGDWGWGDEGDKGERGRGKGERDKRGTITNYRLPITK
ncbi:hypothetical protein NIES2107_68910 (plasmid) [Nostoc carneum NIES-2107]|nr:hypothetical protein NIES2107_68910 [Nostoc carneum NIES-2107]BAY92626.1 hypothetical protein NIES3275_46630 [Microchaete diplosiphon NIES-3275]